MRARLVFGLAATVLAACTSAPGSEPRTLVAPQGPVLLGSSTGVVTLDPRDGSLLFERPGVPALGDWSTVFATTREGSRTLLEASDATSGQVVSSVSLDGRLAVRVASGDGSQVALMDPLPAGASPWVPRPRGWTTIVVTDAARVRDPTSYRLHGNFEPEAFSTDGRWVFLIRYVPPTEPVAYRVARLNLSTGKVSPVNTGTKGVVETMQGTRLEQVGSETMLYTLYTTRPPDYVEDAAHAAHTGRAVAFVHTLSLEDGWAHCVALPKALWGGDPADQAMALSPKGDELYVVDTARDLVTVMDTDRLEVIRTVDVNFGPDAETHAVVGPEGTLFVGTGSRITAIDPTTLQTAGGWTTDAPISALGVGDDALYVAMPGRIEVVDPSTGRPARSIPSPAVEDLAYVGALDQ